MNTEERHGNEAGHVPVLAAGVCDALAVEPGMTLVDATVGRAGHAAMLLPLLAPGGRIIGLDVDPANVAFARQRLQPLAEAAQVELSVVHANFRDLKRILAEHGLKAVDRILADLGFASNQMDDPARGFSFTTDGPLDMRLDPTLATSAADLVNHLPVDELADMIYQYGEERLSRKIARKIGEVRRQQPIETTSALAALVRRCYGPAGRRMRIDPATRTFMALRIAVNDELASVDALLADAPDLLGAGGRVAIISFHSLEDRRVKQRFAALDKLGHGRRVTRKPLVADAEEMQANPRSRSAKLRAFEKSALRD